MKRITQQIKAAESLRDTHERLCRKTENCRPDMHEPDEVDIYAVVTGTHLDNAMGDDPYHNCCEFTVGLGEQDGSGREWFNLADLIALARMANLNPPHQGQAE